MQRSAVQSGQIDPLSSPRQVARSWTTGAKVAEVQFNWATKVQSNAKLSWKMRRCVTRHSGGGWRLSIGLLGIECG